MNRVIAITRTCKSARILPAYRPRFAISAYIPLKAAFAKGMAVPLRSFSSSVPAADQGKERMEAAMNKIEELFAAAKDEMEYAEESQGSVYYHEDRVTAEKAVKDCIDAFDTFLKDLPTDEMRAEVQGKVGMKIKELKMAFEALPEEGH